MAHFRLQPLGFDRAHAGPLAAEQPEAAPDVRPRRTVSLGSLILLDELGRGQAGERRVRSARVVIDAPALDRSASMKDRRKTCPLSSLSRKRRIISSSRANAAGCAVNEGNEPLAHHPSRSSAAACVCNSSSKGRRRRPARRPLRAAGAPREDVPSFGCDFKKRLALHCEDELMTRGESGIRTHEPREGPAVFKTAAFNRSAISPCAGHLSIRLLSAPAVSPLSRIVVFRISTNRRTRAAPARRRVCLGFRRGLLPVPPMTCLSLVQRDLMQPPPFATASCGHSLHVPHDARQVSRAHRRGTRPTETTFARSAPAAARLAVGRRRPLRDTRHAVRSMLCPSSGAVTGLDDCQRSRG